MRTTVLATALLALNGWTGESLAPWAANSHPTDAPKKHVEEITAAKLAYTVTQGGTMDGRNCRSPLGNGMYREGVCEQVFESNRAVRLENIGTTDVVNPWLSNGRNLFRNMDEIVGAAVTKEMSDKEKAFALWNQEIRYRYHFGGDNNELGDPVKVFNVYGHNTCGNDSCCMAGLLRKAGLKAAPARAVGHCISQAFYDGRWHFLDADTHSIYLLRDNETVAGEQDIVRDHDLVKRAHSFGMLLSDDRGIYENTASMYGFEGEVTGERNCVAGTTMNMTLRPGEALTWRWGHLNPIKSHGSMKPLYPDMICNGLWEYRPDFAQELWKKGAASADGIQAAGGALAAETGKTGTVVWIVRSPYVIVGGRLETEGKGAKFAFSLDGKAWKDATENLDAFYPPAGAAVYQYYLKCELSGDASLKRLGIVNDLQMAPLALPEMGVGENAFTYTDQSAGERKVRVTHEWVERSASKPPEAPASPVAPADAAEAQGTALVIQWSPAKDPDGDKIADYHIELSDRPDLRWPVSMNFCKLVSRTPDKGKAQFTVPSPGLLSADKTYYWHVRAKDEKGVWGPWSKTWSFTPRGPNVPLDVTCAYDAQKAEGVLRWKANAQGRAPAKYRVYGSDEKGFTASDEPYKAVVGVSKEIPAQFPANFIAETTAPELKVLGADVTLANAAKAFYRVVAVDEKGSRSGPSDYAAAPRPLITSKPVAAGKAGAEYRYALAAIRSIGDLQLHQDKGRDVAGFYNVETLKYAKEKGPDWLKVDEATGVISGTPAAAGKFEVTVTATLERVVRVLDEATLKWGNEKIIKSGTEKAGVATQTFVLEVVP
ncbi:MAG: putative Ig domain-containing protein [Planctomycetes bacterium]|nr:putative Ig domain-containing protein [Planctomycetota bacterium]